MGGIFGGNDFRGNRTDFAFEPYQVGQQNAEARQAFYDAAAQKGGAQNETLMAQLAQQAQGLGGPSLAEQQLQQATNRNIRQQGSMLASQRGINPALRARLVGNMGAMTGQESAGQAGMLRAQEQNMAQNSLANAIRSQMQYGQAGSQLANQAALGYGGLRNQQNQILSSNDLGAQQLSAGAMSDHGALGSMLGGLGGGIASGLTGGLLSGGGGGGGGASSIPSGPGGKMSGAAMAMGGMVPGDSPQNDVVPAMLSPGEIVLPRSVAQDPDAAEKAKKFVEAIQASHKPDEKVEYRHILASRG